MELTQSNDAHFLRANCARESCAISQDALARIPVCEAEIENFLGGLPGSPASNGIFQLTHAAGARAESVNEPFLGRETRRLEYLHGAGFAETPTGGLRAPGAFHHSVRLAGLPQI